jgi:hypothetical protein
MPDMDGFGFLDEFLNFEDIVTRTPFLCSLLQMIPNDIERALKYPVVKKYFVKPFPKIFSINYLK